MITIDDAIELLKGTSPFDESTLGAVVLALDDGVLQHMFGVALVPTPV